jgi:hypothetical protein
MAGEIQALKKKIIQIVTSTIGSDSEPADYVLSLFSVIISTTTKCYFFPVPGQTIHIFPVAVKSRSPHFCILLMYF